MEGKASGREIGGMKGQQQRDSRKERPAAETYVEGKASSREIGGRKGQQQRDRWKERTAAER